MSGINNYFSNNNIFNGTEIPTQGKFDVGDIIVNIGENAEEEPMWMCIEAGEPGVWKVVGKVEEIDLSGYQEKTDENLVTESKDLVGAINELFQSANNGKELIASAIGEPLNAEDTFSAMSNDINSLLSTFKTNMMNNGITVESGDRFKSLIDKIATMVEEGEGKGMKVVSGNFTYTKTADSPTIMYNTASSNSCFYHTLELGFKPTLCVMHSENNSGYKITSLYYDGRFESTYSSGISGFIYANTGTYCGLTVNSNNITMPIVDALDDYSYNFDWIAVGVGEEDTTLRDSLASILEEEGVSVTEEDDMASLISKVDEEFNNQVVPAGDAVASNVLSGKTFINSTGSTLTGTMANNGTKTITPSASTQTLGAGYYDKITINGDADLVAANIVSGKNIFGVTGTATVSSLGGKRFASGTTTITSIGSSYAIFVTGLDFKPSAVIAKTSNNVIRYAMSTHTGLAHHVRSDTGGAGAWDCTNVDVAPESLDLSGGTCYVGPGWFKFYTPSSTDKNIIWCAYE